MSDLKLVEHSEIEAHSKNILFFYICRQLLYMPFLAISLFMIYTSTTVIAITSIITLSVFTLIADNRLADDILDEAEEAMEKYSNEGSILHYLSLQHAYNSSHFISNFYIRSESSLELLFGRFSKNKFNTLMNIVNDKGKNPLQQAVDFSLIEQRFEKSAILLIENSLQEFLEKKYSNGSTILHHAIADDLLKIVKKLLFSHANPHAYLLIENDHDRNAFHTALIKSAYITVNHILDYYNSESIICSKAYNNVNCLHLIARNLNLLNGAQEVLKQCKDLNFINLRTHKGINPLLCAVYYSNINFIKNFLTEAGIPQSDIVTCLNTSDKRGVTPLAMALKHSKLDIAIILCQHHSNPKEYIRKALYDHLSHFSWNGDLRAEKLIDSVNMAVLNKLLKKLMINFSELNPTQQENKVTSMKKRKSRVRFTQ